MRRLIATAIIALSPALVPIGHSGRNLGSPNRVSPDLEAIFGRHCRCIQVVDRFGTVSRSAFDGSGHRIGTQVGTYDPGEPNKMAVEMIYLEPDATHPRGQAFDGAGNPTPQ
jgi:hypothetical protein